MGRLLGLSLAGIACLASGYEFVAILTPLPTISRVWQGYRDSSPYIAGILAALTILLCLSVAAFAVWLGFHFIRAVRSGL